MKYLITGISGFVGHYLAEYFFSQGHEVTGIDMHPFLSSDDMPKKVSFHQMSLLDFDELSGFIKKASPDRIIHLASASSVALSWERPVECFTNNTNIFLNLIEAVRLCKLKCRILSVGSSEEYGPVSSEEVPIDETRPLNPINPYAVARVAQEQFSKVFSSGYGLDIVCTRSFNHVGPGQTERFVISSFVRQAVEVSLGRRKTISCGDVSIVRDFIDVRDVVRAYGYVLDQGVAGDIYNVCSGRGFSLGDILERICTKLGLGKVWIVSQGLIRPVDNPVIVGNGQKLSHLGFRAAYDLDRSLEDMILWWQRKLVP